MRYCVSAICVEAQIARHGGILVRGPEGALASARLGGMPIPATGADARSPLPAAGMPVALGWRVDRPKARDLRPVLTGLGERIDGYGGAGISLGSS
uniref:Uncharacterized protein n=1 Tax=Aquisalinus luteolus TaxID=1566827 RepID=A0A8J3A7C5_9PROT|nr:hypothetical protein GCM10011355_16640 [Aquisalinus luteolus]